MPLPKKDIAERLRQHREACALSQKQVAQALNIERSTYTKYETGGSEPNLNTIVKIAGIFNISPVELLPVESSESGQPRRLNDVARSDSPIYQLSKEERGLIAMYRALDKEKKQQTLDWIGNLSKKD